MPQEHSRQNAMVFEGGEALGCEMGEGFMTEVEEICEG